MSGLFFNIGANFSALKKLKQELDDLKSRLISLDRASDPKAFDALNSKLEKLTKEYEKQSAAYNRKIAELDTLSKKYDEQTSVIDNYEKQIISLTEQLKNSSKGVDSPEYQELENDLQKVESAYEKVTQQAENTQKAISQKMGVTGNVDKFFDGVDKNADNFIDAINRQREAIKKMELDYINTREKMSELGKRKNYSPENMAEYEKLKKLMVEIRSDMSLEKKDLSTLEKAYKQFIDSRAEATESYLVQMRKLREEMAQLVNADGSVSPQNLQRYEELKTKLSEVGTAYRRVQGEQKLLTSSGSAQLAGLIQGISGLSGAFAAGQGVASLFVKDNEKLAAIQTKLQAAMAITIGLQQVSNTLSATSAFRTQTVTKATQLLSTANTWLATTLGISNVAAKALMATLTLGLSVAITGVIYLINKYTSDQEKAAATTKKFNESVTSSVASQTMEYEKLRKQWVAAKDDLKQKEKLVRENIEAYNSFGVKINDVKDAENLFVKNAEAFRDSMMLRAKSVAAMELATEKYKEYLTAMSDAEKRSTNRSFTEAVSDGAESLLNRFESFVRTISSGKYVENLGENYFAKQAANRDKSESEKLNKESQEWFEKAFGYDEESRKKLKESGGKLTDEIAEGSKTYWQSIRDQQQKIMDANLPDSAMFKTAKKQRDEAAKMLERWDKTNFKGQESAAEKAKKLQQELKALQAKLSNEQLRQKLDFKQKEIDADEEGFNKQLKQNALNYEKELQQIKEFEDDKTKERAEAILKFGKDKVSVQLPELSESNIKAQVEKLKQEALSAFNKSDNDVYKKITEQYQSYADQRLEIEKKFNKDIDTLIKLREKAQEKGDKESVDKLNRSIAKATADKGKGLISFDFERMKEAPEYIRAFEDLGTTSTETLNSLLGQFEKYKEEAAKVLSPKELREYTTTIQSIADELSNRDLYSSLIKQKDEAVKANQRLIKAENDLRLVQLGIGDPLLTEEEAIKRVNKAKDEYYNKNKKVLDTQKKIRDQISALAKEMSGLGNALGGTSGEIISFIGDITSFYTTASEGIEKVAQTGAQAISVVEKASVILTIISTAIQLMKQLNSILPDAFSQYEKYDEKIERINDMRDAVNEYEIAVLKANKAENSWFGNDSLRNLKDYKELQTKIFDSYRDKMLEEQAIYENKGSGGWLTNSLKSAVSWVSKITYGFDLLNKKYKEGTTAAVNNLRIETRKKSSGFLGSGIGGKSQKTEDLVTWTKKNLGFDLFDAEGWINKEAYDAIISKYGDKLVGQTKETLDELKNLRDQYDEYLDQLHEYVSSLYEPLVDNMVDSIWDWFDEGKNALDSFKDYAKDTFRDIVSDMIKTILLKDVFKDFKDNIANLYEEYSKGNLTEAQLSEAVSKETNAVMDRYQSTLPVLQDTVNGITKGIKDITGIDLKDNGKSTSQSSSKGSFETITQDQAGEMNGRLTGIMETNLRSEGYLKSISEWNQPISDKIDMSSIAMPLNLINESSSRIEQMIEENKSIAINSYYELKDINKNTKELYQMNERLGNIEKNTKGFAAKK